MAPDDVDRAFFSATRLDHRNEVRAALRIHRKVPCAALEIHHLWAKPNSHTFSFGFLRASATLSTVWEPGGY